MEKVVNNISPLVSIIIPVYNSEKTLYRCIGSILSQALKNWELILIDDGSKDKSSSICDEYAKNDDRIKVFHKENGGVSSARNLGIDKAKGKWITFVDSDDWIVNGALDINYNEIDEDLLLFSYYSMSLQEKKLERIDECILTNKENLNSFLSEYLINTIFRSPWSKLFKREKLTNIRFDEKIRIGEDTLFMLDFLKEIQSCRVFNKVFYVYNECENSLSSKYKLLIEESIYAMQKFFQSYDRLGIVNGQVEKFIFLDYKLYCYNDISKRHNIWFNNVYVHSFYNRVKKYLSFNYRFRYYMLSFDVVFKFVRLYKKNFID